MTPDTTFSDKIRKQVTESRAFDPKYAQDVIELAIGFEAKTQREQAEVFRLFELIGLRR